MTKNVDFYFDYGSPATYLAWTQIENIINDANANLNMIPMLLGGVFKETGNSSPAFIPAKSKWMNKDLKKHAEIYGVDYNSNSFFPINTLYLMRGAVFAIKNGILDKYNEVIFQAIWNKNINLSDPKNIIDLLDSNSFSSKEFLDAAEDQLIKDELKNNTERAVDLGIFGVPSFIVDDKLFFGQDRMHWFLN